MNTSGSKPLLPLDAAWEILARERTSLRIEEADLGRAQGRILARGVRADRDLPPFDRAALDGYAVRLPDRREGEMTLPIVAEVAAGESGPRRMRPATAVRIWTGAAVPEGAEGIVPVETAQTRGESLILADPLPIDGARRPGIADRGEDARRGALLLPPGRPIGPSEIALLAAVGVDPVPVRREPEIAVVATGSELVPPRLRPERAQIRSSNDVVLSALLRAAGIGRIRSTRIVPDRPGLLREALRRGLDRDVLVVSGGVSMGRHDIVPDLLAELGVRIRFHRVAIRPGKPVLFGIGSGGSGRTAVFGLPGNPLSVLATAVVFLLPFLRAARGEGPFVPPGVPALLERPIRRGGGLVHFVPCRAAIDSLGTLRVRELPIHGSGDTVSAAGADGFLQIPGDGVERPAGERVGFLPLPGCRLKGGDG